MSCLLYLFKTSSHFIPFETEQDTSLFFPSIITLETSFICKSKPIHFTPTTSFQSPDHTQERLSGSSSSFDPDSHSREVEVDLWETATYPTALNIRRRESEPNNEQKDL